MFPARLRILLCFGGLGLALAALAPAKEPNSAAEERAVYQALLERFILPETKELVLTRETPSSGDDSESKAYAVMLKDKLAGVDPKLVDEYIGKTRLPPLLDEKLKLPVKWTLLDKAAMKEIFDGVDAIAGWKRFHEKYPDVTNLISLSMVGFDKDRTTALVHAGEGLGPLGGSEHFYLFRKVKGNWTLQKTFGDLAF